MGRRASSAPTIKDVAWCAEVSVGTVSRVLKGMPDVDAELKRRVEEAIRDLGYRSSGFRLATARREQARVIAFVLCNESGLSAAHEHLLLGIEEYCSEAKYCLLFARHQYEPNADPIELQLPEVLLNDGLAECVIVAGRNYDNFLSALDAKGISYVLLANHIAHSQPQPEHKNQVRYNDFGGFQEATNYLIQLGHKHIWYIGDTSRPWFLNRYEGYLAAMASHGLEPRAHTVALSDDPYENGQAAVSYILEQNWPLTAVMAGSDDLAFGTREALRHAGRNVPHDVSLIGFENQLRRSHAVNLTSVCVDMAEVGRQMAKMAIARIQPGGKDMSEIIVPATLVKRSTCRPVRTEESMVL